MTAATPPPAELPVSKGDGAVVDIADGSAVHDHGGGDDPRRAPEAASAKLETVLEPPGRWASLRLDEVWRYRDLFVSFVWRDIAARYRQSVVGLGWVILKPIISMLVFAFVFGRVAGIKSDGAPYPLFAFAAILPWTYFAGALASATASVVSAGAILRKVYFPRILLPLVGIVVGLVELAVQMFVMALLIVGYDLSGRMAPAGADGVAPWTFDAGLNLLFLPVFVLIGLTTALAVGLWLTALNVRFRDVGQAVPFLTQAWMWLSPIVYPSSLVPEHLRVIYGLNPMVGVIEGFRWSLLGSAPPDWAMVATSCSVVAVLLVSGLYFFQRTETEFADII